MDSDRSLASKGALPLMSLVTNVSDTARWVAVYRAWETARPDALFKDPFAERLAGARGRAIAEAVPLPARNGWPMIIRTKLIDDLILASIAEGCRRVINLAAGFDTRPYRLKLPSSLSWVEADLPAMIDEKERLLADSNPVCELKREKVDLTDPGARSAFLQRGASDGKTALVITEGLLIYLDENAVRSLGRDLASSPSIRWWIADMLSPSVRWFIQITMREQLVKAPLKFAPPEGIAFLESLGWRAREVHPLFKEAARLRRLPLYLRPFALLPAPDPRNPRNHPWSAVTRFERAV
jgi:methyltransferase (TIGR00027 family)